MTDTTKRIAQRRQLKRARAAYRRSVQSAAVVKALHRAMHAPEVMAVSPVDGLRLSSSPGATSSFEKCFSHHEEVRLAAPASAPRGVLPLPRSGRSLMSFELSSGAKA